MNILGLDVSTSITGVAVINKKNEIVTNVSWDFRNKKKFQDIFDIAGFIDDELTRLSVNFAPDAVFIEQSLHTFKSGQSSAQTLSTLSKINGIVSWLCFKKFDFKPQYIAATSARKRCNIKVPRGEKAKQVVIKHAIDNGWMEPEYTHKGNPKPKYFDMADAIVIAKAGLTVVNESL